MMWQVIGASTQGTSHIRADVPCQDAHGYRISGDILVAVVADGLGSAAKADEGAQLATETALDALTNAICSASSDCVDAWTQSLRDAFLQARHRLEETAKKNSLSARDYGTTLIVVVIAPHQIGVGHVGDGAVVMLLDDGTLDTVSPPQRGEYANEVVPLTAPGALDVARFSVRQIRARGIALLTDGLQNLCISAATAQAFQPFFGPFFDAVCRPVDTLEASRDLASFLGSEAVCRKTDDDKTLVVIGRITDCSGSPSRSA